MSQIQRGMPGTLEFRFYSAGVLANLDGLPTLAVVDANGTTVTTGSVTTAGTGIYQATLPGQADLKRLKATWTGATGGDTVTAVTRHEIVGSLLFTLADARAARVTGGQTPFTSTTVFPDAFLSSARTRITDMFEQRTSRSWIRRYSRIITRGSGSDVLPLTSGATRDFEHVLPGGQGRLLDVSRVISATVNGVAVTADVEVDGHYLILTSGAWSPAATSSANVVVEYEYGPDPAPLEAHDYGLDVLLAQDLPDQVSAYATSISNEDGTFRITSWPRRVEEWLGSVKAPLLVG